MKFNVSEDNGSRRPNFKIETVDFGGIRPGWNRIIRQLRGVCTKRSVPSKEYSNVNMESGDTRQIKRENRNKHMKKD